ncbi:MAG: hypothetical protein QW838_02920 [Candidatus Nitrosotenuis sp.]
MKEEHVVSQFFDLDDLFADFQLDSEEESQSDELTDPAHASISEPVQEAKAPEPKAQTPTQDFSPSSNQPAKRRGRPAKGSRSADPLDVSLEEALPVGSSVALNPLPGLLIVVERSEFIRLVEGLLKASVR